MIKLENIKTYGWEAAVRGMRNPMNSWDKSDSGHEIHYNSAEADEIWETAFKVGSNDLALMKKLVAAGTDHRKFMRMINVTMDITAPLYWWKEFDTYKVGTVRNSCSTMHKIHAKEFTLNDFSCEYLKPTKLDGIIHSGCVSVLTKVIDALNYLRIQYKIGRAHV